MPRARTLVLSLLVLGAGASNAQQLPATAPGSRVASLFAYDSLRDRLLMYGGRLTFERGAAASALPLVGSACHT